MPRLLLAALMALLPACGAGVVHPLAFIKPAVKLHHLELKNVGVAGGTLDLVLAFDNPNKISVQGTSLTAGLDIENTHFGDVELSDAFTLAAKDTTLLTVPLRFTWSGVAAAARSVLDYGAVNYKITGRFNVLTPTCAECEIPFSGEGSVPLLRP